MHAVIITAYKDMPQLERFIRRLDPGFFKVFVHVDLRSKFGNAEIERLAELGCKVIRKHRIRWGSYTHLMAILDLLALAAQEDVDYVHLTSGEDYPIATIDEFRSRCDGRIFLEFMPLSDESDYVKDRYRFVDVFHYLLAGPRFFGAIYSHLNGLSVRIQKRIGYNRKFREPYATIYKGTVWSSFPTEAARWLLDDSSARRFLKIVKTTRLPEEIFFQTVYLHSPFSLKVAGDDLRFTDWTKRNGSLPAYLDGTDVEAALARKGLFARKLSTATSQAFMDKVDEVVFSVPFTDALP